MAVSCDGGEEEVSEDEDGGDSAPELEERVICSGDCLRAETRRRREAGLPAECQIRSEVVSHIPSQLGYSSEVPRDVWAFWKESRPRDA